MAKGVSVHVGLNSVDPRAYGGWSGDLVACEYDANDMKALANVAGFDSSVFLTKNATAKNFIGAITAAAAALEPGDFFFLTYSGHGGQIPDASQDEDDGMDETWVLYDRQLLDDELYSLFGKFKAGVRIFMLSDSCHSGTVAKVFANASKSWSGPDWECDMERPRVIPQAVAFGNYKENREMYDSIRKSLKKFRAADIAAGVLLISGCQDWQTSADGDRNGLFTERFLQVWDNGAFHGSYRQLHQSIVARMPQRQQPNLFKVGTGTSAFEQMRPFDLSERGREGASNGHARLEMVLYASPEQLAELSRERCVELVQERGLNVLLNALDAVSQSATKSAKAGGLEAGCSVHDGHWECHGGVHVSF